MGGQSAANVAANKAALLRIITETEPDDRPFVFLSAYQVDIVEVQLLQYHAVAPDGRVLPDDERGLVDGYQVVPAPRTFLRTALTGLACAAQTFPIVQETMLAV